MTRIAKSLAALALCLALLLALTTPAASAVTSAATRDVWDFNPGWKFHLGDVSDPEAAAYDDADWRDVDLPHDYSIEQDYTLTAQGESGYLPGGIGWYRKTFTIDKADAGKRFELGFDGVYMNATVYLNGDKLGDHPYGYTQFAFDVTDHLNVGGENVLAVRVDHELPSSRWYSGSGIFRDVTLTVADPVHVLKDGVVIQTPDLSKNQSSPKTVINTTLTNTTGKAARAQLRQTVYRLGEETTKVKTATTKAFSLKAGQTKCEVMTLKIQNPALWSTDSPNLYRLKTEVLVGGKVVDTVTNDYGYRWVYDDPDTGFYLNGKPLKLKGVCMHHDQGALGAITNVAAYKRQLQILKKMGCNSIRTSHNPPSAEYIDLCNRMGFLVLEEIYDGWHACKNLNYHDFSESFYEQIPADNELLGARTGEYWAEFCLKSAIQRDINDPSVYMWSIGNEVNVTATGLSFADDAKNLVQWAQEVDTTRMLTIGDSGTAWYDISSEDDHNQIYEYVHASGGMIGQNYASEEDYATFHEENPGWRMYASEDVSATNSRGVYKREDLPDHQLTAYDESTVSWGKMAAQCWLMTISNDYIAGEYVWTGFDYLGEPTPWDAMITVPYYGWPAPKSSYFGIVDLAGFPKDSYWFYQSQWRDDVTTLHILPQWQEDVVEKDEDGNVKVVVYSNAKSVELFFTDTNGKKTSLGKKTFSTKKTKTGYTYQIYTGKDKSETNYENLYFSWNVPYRDGTLSAVAYDKNGKKITNTQGSSEVTTFGKAAKLQATVYGNRKTIQADGQDLAYIEVSILDKDGNFVANAADNITVTVNGKAAKLLAVDNGDATDLQRYDEDNRNAFNGRFLAIVQSTGIPGTFTVTVKADGLESATVTLNAQ